jgi:GDP-mannose 6-dehydrogenase
MNISIFGLGYVGCVSMGCLAQSGHKVIGVDVSEFKVNLINNGLPTIVEKGIADIIKVQRENSSIEATLDTSRAVLNTDVSIIAVGTPSTVSGHLNLDYLINAAKQIGEVLKNKPSFHVIVIRSTVLPGTNHKIKHLIAEISGKNPDTDFGVVSNPEFLREGSAVFDYFHPPYSTLGSDSRKSIEIVKQLYSDIEAPMYEASVKTVELLKYVNNSFHALKVAFTNEVGTICKQLGIDSHELMTLFVKDTKLNISPYYMKPGFAYGGSCLPKDLKALKTISHDNYLETPIISSIEVSNNSQIERTIKIIESKGNTKIGIIGISFKQDTDDLRNSPIIDVIESLLGRGYDIKVFDENVALSMLVGQNKSYIMEKLPHIGRMLIDDLNELVTWSETIVITNNCTNLSKLNLSIDKSIIDLIKIDKFMGLPKYEGINW